MKNVVITRLDVPANREELSDDEFHHYRYPFDTLPLLESHLHPKFVIFDAGQKISNLAKDSVEFEKFCHDFPALQISSILDLYTSWTRQPGPAEWERRNQDPSYYVPDDDDDSKPGRPHPKKKRKNQPSNTLRVQPQADSEAKGW